MSNETSSFSSLSRIPILTGSTDYARWSLAIKNAAMMADVWEYLDGTETCPEVAAEDKKPTDDEKAVEQAVVYSTLPQEYSTLTFRGEVVADDGGVEERSEVMYCIEVRTYIYYKEA